MGVLLKTQHHESIRLPRPCGPRLRPPRSSVPSSCPPPWFVEAAELSEALRPTLVSSLTRSLCSEEELVALSCVEDPLSEPTGSSLPDTAVMVSPPADWESGLAATTCTRRILTRLTSLWPRSSTTRSTTHGPSPTTSACSTLTAPLT